MVKRLSGANSVVGEQKSNITVFFAEGEHGDSLLFDGVDGELAHSSSLNDDQSPFRGHIHLDDAEQWDGKKTAVLGYLTAMFFRIYNKSAV